MADDRQIAGETLTEALRVIMTERGSQHGSAENSFDMIAKLWSSYLEGTMFMLTGEKTFVVVTPRDVAQMMVLLKIARSVFGQPDNKDHYVDAAGYTALAAMIATPPAPPEHQGKPIIETEEEPRSPVGYNRNTYGSQDTTSRSENDEHN